MPFALKTYFLDEEIEATGELWFKELHIVNFSLSQDLNPVFLTQHFIFSILLCCFLTGKPETCSVLKWKIFFLGEKSWFMNTGISDGLNLLATDFLED